MVVSWWWISDGAIGSKNEKKTIQDCLVGGVNPFEENLSTWIVSLDNSEHSKNIFIWNHIETTTYKMGHYYSCKWNGVMGSLYMAENKWLSGALTKKMEKKKHQSINPRLLIPIASMYGIFTYIWLIFMVNVGKYTLHGCYGICEAWLVGSYHVAKVPPSLEVTLSNHFTSGHRFIHRGPNKVMKFPVIYEFGENNIWPKRNDISPSPRIFLKYLGFPWNQPWGPKNRFFLSRASNNFSWL